ncbi:sarcosine oxidase subunit gamma family protein [Nesterenkonia sp.]|uniref:sarcosine oxidase subunit gamma n=1 Tax=Nesterenkonia sp. TaxID=704201 RepID=UPI002621E315|nr:sarcosine oxidase subunit gamma family protein [Nesterenkonia sp.]
MAETLTQGPPDLRVSPLQHLHRQLAAAAAPGPQGLEIREVAFTTQLGLRAEPGSQAHTRFAEVLEGLPSAVGETTGTPDGVATLWLAPDEFLVVASGQDHQLLQRLEHALGEAAGQVVDLSANRTTVELSGGSARDALEKGVPADLHPREFPVGRAITTTLGPVPVLLWRTEDSTFRILVRSSFADYAARWLLDAAEEYRPRR